MKPQNLFSEDWDICIILDACRFDSFEQENTIKGELEPRISPNSCTKEWIQDAFPSEAQHDLIYLSANPYISNTMLIKFGKEVPYFHMLYPIWSYGWSDTLLTVHPEEVNNEVFKHIGRYKNKKYIIHYMQPHYPFIGSKHHDGVGFGADTDEFLNFIGARNLNAKADSEFETIWSKLENGEVEPEVVKGYYTDNLRFVLQYVKKVVKKYRKKYKIVITADHGNCFGEHGLYDHPCNKHVPELVTVPWFVAG